MSAASQLTSDVGPAKQSAPHSTPVRSSSSPLVVEASNSGGRTAVSVRSPAFSRSPGLSQRTRVGGSPNSTDCRSGLDFSARERLLLGLLRPHLDAVWLRADQRRRGVARLTPRQRELLMLVAAGHSNAEIASRLFISVGTVRKHLDRIFDQLGVGSRTAAVAQMLSPRVR
jgi:DNA-binding CsgD family transcriptional regulator